jgi:hypothetical protein
VSARAAPVRAGHPRPGDPAEEHLAASLRRLMAEDRAYTAAKI